MIKLLYLLGLLTREEAQRLQESYIPLRVSALANAGLAVAVLGLLATFGSCGLALFPSSLFRIELPHPFRPVSSPPPETDSLFPESEPRDSFRAKVDRLQLELEGLVLRQADLEAKLQSKTSESQELSDLTQRLREEVRLKEREINALTGLRESPNPGGRQFTSGTTAYHPPSPKSDLQGFLESDERNVRPATAPPDFPAELVIAISPGDAQPGDSYRLQVQIHNRGNRSIHLTGLELAWTFGGRNSGGALPFHPQAVGPRSTLLLHQVDGIWFEDLHTAAITATVTLKEGGHLTNSLSW